MKINFNAIIFIILRILRTVFIDFEYFAVIFGGFLTFWKISKSKMADPRWQLFWHYDVIVMWCDVIITRA